MRKTLYFLVIVIILGLGWYLASPLFIEKEINDDFPLANITEEDREDVLSDLEGFDLPSVDEMKKMNSEEVRKLEEEILEESGKKENVVDEEMSDEPKVLLSGMFVDQDSFHKGSGEASIYELEDGSKVLRFENFEVTNGPDLRVLLSGSSSLSSSSDLGDYVELSKLKGNKGNQNYDISSDVDLSKYKSVVIYCKPFHVIFSTASLN